jgi:hypothetical protein
LWSCHLVAKHADFIFDSELPLFFDKLIEKSMQELEDVGTVLSVRGFLTLGSLLRDSSWQEQQLGTPAIWMRDFISHVWECIKTKPNNFQPEIQKHCDSATDTSDTDSFVLSDRLECTLDKNIDFNSDYVHLDTPTSDLIQILGESISFQLRQLQWSLEAAGKTFLYEIVVDYS